MSGIAKIDVTVGSITFSGEGTEAWLEKQLDKLLAAAPTLAAAQPGTHSEEADGAERGEGPVHVGPLPLFLEKKNASSNHVRRFLATTEWLHLKGTKRVRQRDVTSALSSANQRRSANPTNNLDRNVGKGFIEREGELFYVTPEGRKELG